MEWNSCRYNNSLLSNPKKFSITALSGQLPFRLRLAGSLLSEASSDTACVGIASPDPSAGSNLFRQESSQKVVTMLSTGWSEIV